MEWLIPSLIASVVGGGLSAAGSVAGANAQADASKDASRVNWDIYRDQARRNQPWEDAGKNALNVQNMWLGLPTVGGGGSSGGMGSPTSADNPYGQSNQWAGYLQSNPDVFEYWKGNAKLREMYPNANDFAAYHYANFGQNEGRQLPTSGDKGNQPVGGAVSADGSAPATGGNALSSMIKSNPLWAAGMEVNDAEFANIKGQLGSAGKAVSGTAENRYAKTLKDNTYRVTSDIYNQYAGLSGAGFNAAANTNQLGSNAASNNANLSMQRGNALASGYSDAAQGIGNAISGFTDSYFKYGQPQTKAQQKSGAY